MLSLTPLAEEQACSSSYLKHSSLRDNQQDVRASVSLLQGHQLIHGPWLPELEWGTLPTHPALAVHIAELVELGSWFGQVAGCGKNGTEPQSHLWLSSSSRSLFLFTGGKVSPRYLLSTPLGLSLGDVSSSSLPSHPPFSNPFPPPPHIGSS